MANCPMCGGKVPLGGGKTVSNAGALSAAVQQVQASGKSVPYLFEGLKEAEWLHRYGHKDASIANLPRGEVMKHFQRAAAILSLARQDLSH